MPAPVIGLQRPAASPSAISPSSIAGLSMMPDTGAIPVTVLFILKEFFQVLAGVSAIEAKIPDSPRWFLNVSRHSLRLLPEAEPTPMFKLLYFGKTQPYPP